MGVFLFDDFQFAYRGEEANSAIMKKIQHMTQFVLDTKAPYVNKFTSFALQRPDEQPCQLPMKYLGTQKSGTSTYTQFERSEEQNSEYVLNKSDDELFNFKSIGYTSYRGDEQFYSWLKNNSALRI